MGVKNKKIMHVRDLPQVPGLEQAFRKGVVGVSFKLVLRMSMPLAKTAKPPVFLLLLPFLILPLALLLSNTLYDASKFCSLSVPFHWIRDVELLVCFTHG